MMLSILLSLINPLSTIASKIVEARIATANATTDREKIAAEERVKTLEQRRAVLVAESGSRLNSLMRAAYGVPPAIYLGKLYVWDKVLGWGVTDPLSPMMENVLWTVVGFYFLQWTVSGFRK
jgi:hypothetical protein